MSNVQILILMFELLVYVLFTVFLFSMLSRLVKACERTADSNHEIAERLDEIAATLECRA